MPVTVKCECGFILGKFSPMGDHGGVLIVCPHCERTCAIHNNPLMVHEAYPEPTILITRSWYMDLESHGATGCKIE